MTIFTFGLRISSLFFWASGESSAIFSGRHIIFRGSWYSISMLLPSENTSVVGYVRSYTALCFFVIAAVQQLRFLRRLVAGRPTRVNKAIILSEQSTRWATWCDDVKLCAIERSRWSRDGPARRIDCRYRIAIIEGSPRNSKFAVTRHLNVRQLFRAVRAHATYIVYHSSSLFFFALNRLHF